ncbi:hypothetical protein LJ707_13395 [Mucilaginibacter sp. UR6-1]|uniref:hypothetical protein n=1 Tax=Mucilaginibacter sp. UR6-1 TaxID=1435643 RepID=UPI001E5E4B2B|nr:hypothetical protein [Mucilaginibacter sp. UR6-1]MCC8409927.1 hypothetical protein [Mucilaginibacter sp. UR6-1]
MSEQNKWHSKWWASSILLPVAASAIYDWIKEKPFSTSLISWIKAILNFIVGILTFEIEVWHILIFLIVIAIIFFVSIKSRKSVDKSKPHSFLSYTSDRFKNWLWSWEYDVNYRTNTYTLKKLVPVCEYCNIPMLELYNTWESGYVCPKCERKYTNDKSNYENREYIHALIGNKVKEIQDSV